MKAKLNKLLRGVQAHWVRTKDEPLVGLLLDGHTFDAHWDPLTKFAVNKGWVESRTLGKFETFFFTDKGVAEVLLPLKNTTCAFSGRAVR